MDLKESIHNELVNLYKTKELTIEERFNNYFGDKDLNENIEDLGYFILKESYNDNTINEGLGSFISGLFGNLGGNVEQQLKEWAIGKAMDWFVKPFFNKVGGEDSGMYESIKKYVQITFAEMPFTEMVSTLSDCDKVTKLMTYGLFEYLLDNMLSKLRLDGVIVDNIRQELDRKFIEESGLAEKISSLVSGTICGKSESIREKLKNLSFS
jgi:hypothetical protein